MGKHLVLARHVSNQFFEQFKAGRSIGAFRFYKGMDKKMGKY